MARAIQHAVIMDQAPGPVGTRIEFQPQCSNCGFTRQGAPMTITTHGQGQKRAGSVQCERCSTTLEPIFQA